MNPLHLGALVGLIAMPAWMLTVMGPDLAHDATLIGWSLTLILAATLKACLA